MLQCPVHLTIEAKSCVLRILVGSFYNPFTFHGRPLTVLGAFIMHQPHTHTHTHTHTDTDRQTSQRDSGAQFHKVRAARSYQPSAYVRVSDDMKREIIQLEMLTNIGRCSIAIILARKTNITQDKMSSLCMSALREYHLTPQH